MIGQSLSNKNEKCYSTFLKIFLQTKPGLYEIVAVHVESSINSSLEWSIPVDCGQEGVELIHAIAMRDTIE
jgi:hypothetical protein